MDPLDALRRQRLEKLNTIREKNIIPYAYKFERTHFAQNIIQSFSESGELSEQENVAIAGRLMAIRKMGKAGFCHLMDRTGRIQIYVKQDEVGDEGYEVIKMADIGDIVGATGPVFKTRTGEITVLVKSLTLLAKTLRPLPIVKEKIEDDEKILFDQFADKELRYRQRYVDLIVNPEVKQVFVDRSKIVSSLRTFLEEKGYLEVETPVLQPVYGGAYARPFVTHHNTLDMDLYLRIADELYLKRLIVGGFDGVFEIAKDFRNEGMDRDHNPEFTMLELYIAYEDYYFMMDLVEEMIRHVCIQVFQKTKFEFNDTQLDFSTAWKRISYFDAIRAQTGFDLYQKDEKEIIEAAKKCQIDIDGFSGKSKLLDVIFGECVEPKLIQPTFIMDYPLELSPLAKKHRTQAGLVERFEGYVGGKELCNAFSELNDPIDQKTRFEEQAALRAAGDDEAMILDQDYIRALEYGMPPTTGLGIGIDRLIMILTNSTSIRDVILFPHMRSEKDIK